MFVRKLTQEEYDTYSAAIFQAVANLPAFRPALALMRPFFDETASTAYTDRYSRVGLSQWFFEENTPTQRATVLLHEAFHIINNSFLRGEALGATGQTSNIASDLEINTGLVDVERFDIGDGIVPGKESFEDYPKFLTMEQYYALVMEDERFKKKDCPKCSGTGKKQEPKDDVDTSPKVEPEDPQNGSGDDPSSGDDGPSDADESGESDPSSEADADSGDGGDQGDENAQGDSGSDSSSGGDQGNSGSDSGSDCSCSDSSGDGNGGSCSGCDGSDKSGGSQGSGGGTPCTDCSGTGDGSRPKGTACDPNTDARSSAADEAGIERASDSEISSAKEETLARIVDQLNSGKMSREDAAMAKLLVSTLNIARKGKIDWRKLLTKVIVRAEAEVVKGNAQVSYRRPSRRTSGDVMLPGTISFLPSIMIGLDTSGSMGLDDYEAAVTEVESVVKNTSRSREGLKLFCIDTDVRKINLVRSVEDIDFHGGGGTRMEVGWDYVSSLGKRNRPSIYINITDGYIDWHEVEEQVTKTRKEFISMMLVTTKHGFDSAPESIKKKIKVICISDET